MLTLDEWKVFCKKQIANISKHTGVTLSPVDEQTMAAQWDLNRFEGKKGITLNDFHQKALWDGILMRHKKAQAEKKQEEEDKA
jgi:hypothetical protein